jgi:hypothetical protein
MPARDSLAPRCASAGRAGCLRRRHTLRAQRRALGLAARQLDADRAQLARVDDERVLLGIRPLDKREPVGVVRDAVDVAAEEQRALAHVKADALEGLALVERLEDGRAAARVADVYCAASAASSFSSCVSSSSALTLAAFTGAISMECFSKSWSSAVRPWRRAPSSS